MKLSDLLVQERKKSNKTQQTVANDLFITRQSLSNWENGKNYPDIPTLIQLSDYYGFSLDIMKDEETYMSKIKDDYDLINIKKANKKYTKIIMCLFALIIIPCILISFINPEKSKIIFIILLAVPLISAILLMVVGYKFQKEAFKIYKNDKNAPLILPRTYGIGFSLNPYRSAGKWIYILLTIFLIGVSVFVLISSFIKFGV